MAPADASRTRGFALALAGTISVTPDAVLVRITNERFGGSFWWVISFKCFFLFAMILAFVMWQHGCAKLVAGFRAAPTIMSLACLMQCLVTIGFPAAFQT